MSRFFGMDEKTTLKTWTVVGTMLGLPAFATSAVLGPCSDVTSPPAGSRHLVVMGVSGSGKSTVAQRLAAALDLELAEGDDFHPRANIDKMASGSPLTDEDRAPWLESLASWTTERRTIERSTVLTCSALKRAYRDVLRRADPATYFVHLHGTEAVLRERMARREHFMPASLLRSQLGTLERLGPDELGIELDVRAPVDDIVIRVLGDLPD